ncbi:MAG: hypothetical protein HXX18_10235 [Bacteroidetes bacterium]|nr:hypothetical protein [Bacteroidota bacterium]
MKKVFLLFVAIIGFAAISSNVSAQTIKTTEKATVKTEKTVATPGNFVDKDKNGICDKHEVKGGKGCCDKQAGKANCDGKGKANCTAKEQQGKSCENDKAKSCGNHKGSCNGCKHGQTK